VTIRSLHIGNRLLQFQDASRNGVRWIVGSAGGARSNTWRLWGNKKGDLYLAVRSLGGIVKASFHRDRRCQVGFTTEYQETARTRFGATQRHWDTWSLPSEPWVRVAQIVIPGSDLASFSGSESPETTWLPPPASESASLVSIFVAEPPAIESWPDLFEGVTPLALFTYATRTAWAVSTTISLDTETVRRMNDGRERANQLPGAADAPRIPSTRAVLWGSSSGAPHDLYFYELAWK
jgi:hypothetical protein